MPGTVDEILSRVMGQDASLDIKLGSSITEGVMFRSATHGEKGLSYSDVFPTKQSCAALFCQDVLNQAQAFKDRLPEGAEIIARVVLSDGSSIAFADIYPLNSDTVVCIGVNQAGLPAEVVVSVSAATLKLEAVPASEEYARQQRVGFLSKLTPPNAPR
jgi:hypothetical protein